MLPSRKSAFRAGFWPDCNRENTEIGPPAGPAGGPISVLSRKQSGQNPARKADLRPGSTIVQHRVTNRDLKRPGPSADADSVRLWSVHVRLAYLRSFRHFQFKFLGARPGHGHDMALKSFYSLLRNNASGPEIGLPGRILAGLLPGRHRNRPSGRPSAGRRADLGGFAVAVRPKSGPEGRFTARKHYCVT